MSQGIIGFHDFISFSKVKVLIFSSCANCRTLLTLCSFGIW